MGSHNSKDNVQMRSRDYVGAGKVAIVTGPTGTGIGFHTARWLAERGVHVILAGRSQARLTECEVNIRAEAKNADGTPNVNVQLTPLILDLGSLASVESFVSSYSALNLPRLDLLINNAGIMATPYQHTTEGIEVQFGTNHVAHHHLSQLLLPSLVAAAPSRIVNVSSMAHKRANVTTPTIESAAFHPTESSYGAFSSYGNSKLGNILHARGLNSRYAAQGVTAYSLHPGVVATELGRQGNMTKFIYSAFTFAMKGSEEGAGTSIFCATNPAALPNAGSFFDRCDVATKYSAASRDDVLAEAVWTATEAAIVEFKTKQSAAAASAPAASAPAAASTPAAAPADAAK